MKFKLLPFYLFLVLSVFSGVQKLYACHAIALVNTSITVTPTGINTNASSDSPTCGCGNYWLDVEVQCNNLPFANICGSTSAYGPFISSGTGCYGSSQMPKPSCVVQAYPQVFIPFAGLCPGTTYKLRMREHHGTATPPVGPWSVTYTFTTPGVPPPPLTVSATASPNPICAVQNVQLNAITGGGNCGTISYQWSPATFLNNATIANPTAVNVNTTITYTVTASNCLNSATATVTITFNPPAVGGTASASPNPICAGQTTTLTLTGYSGTSIQWQSGPTSGGPWTNVPGGTTTPFVVGPLSTSTWYQCVVSNNCGSTTSTAVLVTVNPLPVIACAPVSICIGSCNTLNASGASTYTWSPATGLSATTGATVNACPLVTTTYTITGTSSAGCTATGTVTVTVNPLPTIACAPIAICSGNCGNLNASGANTYTWSPATGLSATTGATVNACPTVTTTYTITGTNANGCTNTTTVTVTINPSPAISVTPASPTVCPTQSVVLTASGAVTYTWGPSTGLSATTGAVVTATPAVTTTYTVIGTNAFGCTASTTVTVTVANNLSISVTPNPAAICIGGNVVLNASGATTYTWGPSTGLSATTGATVTASPTATTTYTIVGTSGTCTASTTVQVTVNPLPTITCSPVSFCIGGNANLNASGASTYTWGPATGLSATTGATVNASPIVTTTYTITGTNANGCTNTTTVVVTVYPLPTVTINPNAPVTCPNQPVNLSASGASTYTWSPATYLNQTTGANVISTPAVTTTYTVTGTSVNGCTGTAVVTVTVQNNFSVTVTAAPNDSICSGSSTTLSCTAGVIYSWTPTGSLSNSSIQNPVASPTATTTYTVMVTDAGGCTGSSTITIVVSPPLTIAAQGYPELCNGNCTGQVIAIPGGGFSPLSILWSTNSTSASVQNLCAGTYTVTITDLLGCTISDTAIVVSPPAITSSATVTTAHCNQPDGSATVISSGGVGNHTYSWSTNPVQTSATATGLLPGNYCVTVTDQNGCTDSTCVIVPNLAGVIASISGSSQTSCFNACDGTATGVASNSTGPYSYSWNTVPVQTTATATGLCAGNYVVTITDSFGCTDTAGVTITQPSQIVITPGSSQTICIGQCITLTASATGGNGNYTFNWTPAGPNVCPTVTTTYTVTVTDVNGCTATPQTVTITVNPPLSVLSTGPVAICPGFSTPVSANASGGSGTGYSYVWSPATGLSCTNCQTPTASPTVTTTYTVTVTDNCGTPAVTDTLTVTVHPSPMVVITSDTTEGCLSPDVCIQFTDASTVLSGTITAWTWNFGDLSTSSQQNPAHCYTGAGNSYQVSLTVTSNNGCTASSTVPYTIITHDQPDAQFSLGPQPATILNPIICFTDSSQGGPIVDWQWDFGDPTDANNLSSLQNPCHLYGDTGTYCVTLTVTNTFGCIDSIEHCLVIDPDFVLYIPNAFSPDGNGINETFCPRGEGVDEDRFEMYIYDRWGNLIFSTQRWGYGWDGKVTGFENLVQEDVYVWKVIVYDFKGEKHSFVGHVTVLR